MNTGETTVLVVEPDLDTQRVYRQRLIHDPDIKLIGICSSIASATALLAQTNCDILFTELNLPDEDGLDFIRRASEDLAVQNIVAVTSKNSAADIAAAVENGAVGYITKQDSDLHDVGNYIRILRAHGSPISPTAARVLVDALRRKPAVKPVVSVAASRPAVANPFVTKRNRSSQSSCPRHELRRDQFGLKHLLSHGHGAHQEDLPQASSTFPRGSGLRSRPAWNSSVHVRQKPKARTFGFFFQLVFYFFKTQSPLLPPCFSSKRMSVMHIPRSTALSMS